MEQWQWRLLRLLLSPTLCRWCMGNGCIRTGGIAIIVVIVLFVGVRQCIKSINGVTKRFTPSVPTAARRWTEVQTMPELKPCPFCGGAKLKIDSKRTFQYGGKRHCAVTVRCMQCHARSPVVGINMPDGRYNEREICESAVIEAWNRREPHDDVWCYGITDREGKH